MAIQAKRKHAVSSIRAGEVVATVPNPAQVRTLSAEIRDGWSNQERQRRASLARSMLLRQFLAFC